MSFSAKGHALAREGLPKRLYSTQPSCRLLMEAVPPQPSGDFFKSPVAVIFVRLKEI